MYLCLQCGGIMAGFACYKRRLSSWFRVRVCGSWKPALCLKIHVFDLVVGAEIISYVSEKVSFQIPVHFQEVSIQHLCMKWTLVGQDRSLLPRFHLDGVALRLQVTSMEEWNRHTPHISPLSSPRSPPAPYAHMAWTKKHQLANHLSLLVEHYMQAPICDPVPAPQGSPLQLQQQLSMYKDALIANFNISISDFELR